jgi:hypothetical protein
MRRRERGNGKAESLSRHIFLSLSNFISKLVPNMDGGQKAKVNPMYMGVYRA